MSNKIYQDGLYNEQQKQMFLKGLTKNTHASILRILSRARVLEEQLNKDLYNFSLNEIERLIIYLNPTKLNSVVAAASIIQGYIRWAIEQDLRNDNINPLDIVFGDEYFNKFVDKTNQTVFSYKEITYIIDRLMNYQDAGIVLALFEGIVGKKYSEILNLLKSDVKKDSNTVVLKNDVNENTQETRIITVSNDLTNLLLKAAEQTVYYKNNGHPSENIKAPTSDLIDNDYIFRNSKLNTKENGSADAHLVLRRLTNVRKWFDYPFFNAINIRNSGMLYMAYQLYENNKKFGKAEFDAVCEHYNISKLKNSNEFNASRLRKEFLNIETIERIYGAE
ncbi:hypothetical protein D3C87_624420 [compost metagenome]